MMFSPHGQNLSDGGVASLLVVGVGFPKGVLRFCHSQGAQQTGKPLALAPGPAEIFALLLTDSRSVATQRGYAADLRRFFNPDGSTDDRDPALEAVSAYLARNSPAVAFQATGHVELDGDFGCHRDSAMSAGDR